jgi:hypothetical protein
MDNDERVLQFVKEKGPLLPIHIVKELGGNTILIGAILSTLSENGKIKVSSAKIGGSPLYYCFGQEQKLDSLYKYLHEKEQKAFNLLKENKILRDSSLDPVMRVALRAIKDFAKPLEVDIQQKTELFWKWYLTSNEEAEVLIRQQLKLTKGSNEEEKPKERKSEKTETLEKKKTKEIGEELIKERQKQESQNISKKEVESEKKVGAKEKKEKNKETKEKINFSELLTDYFKKNNIEVVEKERMKSKEIDFIVKVPSAIGHSMFYCKAKDKKTINEGDLSTAYVQAESKKLPVLFLTTGDLSKKAKEMVEKQFKNFVIKKIELQKD